MNASEDTAVSGDDAAVLETLRALERRRIEAIRGNDADAMATVLDDKFLYINSSGMVYDKESYLLAVRTHQLTYSADVDLTFYTL